MAFYAFIGFEDLVNTAEEMKNPQKDLPRAIIIVMILSTVLYLFVTVVNLLGVPVDQLTADDAEPSLTQLYKVST